MGKVKHRKTAVAYVYSFAPDFIYVRIRENGNFSYLIKIRPFSLFVGGIFPCSKPRHVGAEEYRRINFL